MLPNFTLNDSHFGMNRNDDANLWISLRRVAGASLRSLVIPLADGY
jgi:hypothetical protein